MSHTLDVLKSPMTLPCGQTLKNRIVKSAMTEGIADPDGTPYEGHVTLYHAWSRGGSGLLISGNVMVTGTHLERPGNVILDGQQASDVMERLKTWSKAGSQDGCKIWMQISHSGRQCQKAVNPHPHSPSDVTLGLPGGLFGKPVPLTTAEIEGLIGDFARVAKIAEESGFHGVQIHGAHGYLISQFLSPRVNLRTDEWGGSLENRARFLRRIVQAVRAQAGDGFAVSVKLNSSDFQKGGFDADDAKQVAEWLTEDGIDLLEISGGSYEQPRMMKLMGIEPVEEIKVRQSTRQREAYFQDFASDICADIKVPLLVTGGFRTAEGMADAIDKDGISLVGLGRPLCGAPDCVNALLSDGTDLPSYEKILGNASGFFGVTSPIGLVRALAAFAVTSWYYAQIVLIASGQSTNLKLSSFKSFLTLQGRDKKWLKARQKNLKG